MNVDYQVGLEYYLPCTMFEAKKYFRTPCSLSQTKAVIKDGLSFQVLEWQDTDEDYISVEDTTTASDSGSDEEDSRDIQFTKRYLIRAFGVTADSKSVCLSIQDYTPFFYIKVPDYFTDSHKASLLEYIESRRFPVDKTWYTFRGSLVKEQCRFEEKKDFYGFQNNKKHKFIRLVFRNLVGMKQASYLFNKSLRIDSISTTKSFWFDKYESNVDQLIRFVHTRELQTAGWVSVEKDHLHIDNSSTSCQINLSCLWVFVNPDDERTDIAPLIQASFDIECFSGDYSFPRPEVSGNVVTAIATAFKRYGESDFFLKHIITLKKSNPLKGISGNVILECYDTEREVLLAWKRLICGIDPDIIYSYNGDQFDCNYLIVRSKGIANCYDEFSQLSRIKGLRCDISEQTFSSGAYGSTDFKRLGIPGRINFDILIYIKRELKLDSYKLDNVAEKYLKEKKHDVTVAQIFDYFRSGDPEKIRVITEYCVQDTLLPQRLVDKLDILPIQIEMARITYVPFRYLIEKGQQIKVFSQLVKRTRKAGFLIPHLKYTKNDTAKFKGAYVLDPVVGAHFDPVATLDFASLYPTIMMAHNFCYSSIVLDKQYLGLEAAGVEYHRVKWKETNEDNQSYFFDYSFVQNTETVIPKLLSDLYKSRKMVKKLMAKETDPFKKSVLNGRQLAIKVSMNSVYGFLAAQTLCCKPISASVTATGREMIDATSNYAETTFVNYINTETDICKGRKLTCKTIYGDSVTGDTPLVLKNKETGLIEIKTIETLSDSGSWNPYEEFKSGPAFNTGDTNRKEKLQAVCEKYQVWTTVTQGKGMWTDIKRVIKHKVNKGVYRVSTPKGCVDVTEDHSLLSENGEKLKPKDCSVGTKLLQSFPTREEIIQKDINIDITFDKHVKHANTKETGVMLFCKRCNTEKDESFFPKVGKTCRLCHSNKYYEKNNRTKPTYTSYTLTPEEAWVWGFFYADGSAGSYESSYGIKHTWAINNQNLDYLNKAKAYLEKCDSQNEFKILQTLKSSGVYKLVVKGDVFYYAKKYRELFYDKDKYKIVPIEILNATIEVKKAFFDGYYTGDGAKTGSSMLTNKGKIGAQGLYFITKSIGLDYRVSNYQRKEKCYKLYEVKKSEYYKHSDNEIKRIIPLPATEDFVYDLETDCGRFNAGIGEICVSNTDSVFLKFDTGKKDVEAMRDSFKLGELCADMATKALFKPPIMLEYEKSYSILLMFKKKMYIGALHETSPEKYDYIDTKGVVLKRRDNCPLLKTVYQGALDQVIAHKQEGVPGAIQFIRQWIRDLVNNKVDVSQLTLSKSLSGGYADDCNTPHVVLARKLMARDPGSAPKPGDRVPYVFIDTGNPKHKQFEKVEDPEYVRKKGLKIDTVYYIEHQLKNPLTQFLSLFEDKPEQIFEEALRESQNKLSKQNEITRFFIPKSK